MCCNEHFSFKNFQNLEDAPKSQNVLGYCMSEFIAHRYVLHYHVRSDMARYEAIEIVTWYTKAHLSGLHCRTLNRDSDTLKAAKNGNTISPSEHSSDVSSHNT